MAGYVTSEHLYAALAGRVQAEHGAQQDRLPCSRPANDPENFILEDGQVDTLVYGLVSEAIHHVPDLDNGFAHQPSSVKMIENTASTTITMNIDSTTALVVLRPTASAERST